MRRTDEMPRRPGTTAQTKKGNGQITPEQRLMQALVESAMEECRIYRETGIIPLCPRNLGPRLNHDNIRALRMMDEGYLLTAGFKKHRTVLKAIEDTISLGADRPRNDNGRRRTGTKETPGK